MLESRLDAASFHRLNVVPFVTSGHDWREQDSRLVVEIQLMQARGFFGYPVSQGLDNLSTTRMSEVG